MATHFSILAWRIPVNRGAWQATVHGLAKSLTQLDIEANAHFTIITWNSHCWGQCEESRRDSILKPVIHLKDRM